MAQVIENVTRIDGGDRQVAENLPTDSELIERWVHRMESLELSKNTIKLYRTTVERFAQEVPRFLDADEDTIQSWLEAKGGKAGTFNNRVSGLTNFYRWAKKSKLIDSNPCTELDKPKNKRGIPKPVRDVAAVLDEMDRQDVIANERGSKPRKVGETRAMAVVLANTGLRIHEAIALELPVPCPAKITLIGKGNKEAFVRFNAKAQEAMDFLGGKWPIGARATQRRFEKVHSEHVTPHKWRHTFATQLISNDIEIGTVSKLCRHSSVSTTMIYAEYAEGRLDEAVNGL